MKITNQSICKQLYTVLRNYNITYSKDFSINTFIEDITLNYDIIDKYLKNQVCSDGYQDTFCSCFKSYMDLSKIAILSLDNNHHHSMLRDKMKLFKKNYSRL